MNEATQIIVSHLTPSEYQQENPECTHSYRHIVQIKVNGILIGEATMQYKRFPSGVWYSIEDIFIQEDYRWKGYGKILLAGIRKLLDKKKKVGYLTDTIQEHEIGYWIYEWFWWIVLSVDPEGSKEMMYINKGKKKI